MRVPPRLRRKNGRSSQQMIEALEDRRMLAVFNGTSGADTIILYKVGGVPHVMINGTAHSTLDTSIRVNALAGDDDIHMHDWAAGTVVDLGGGYNHVYYGGPSHALLGELPAATIMGTDGTYPPDEDEVYFYDDGGGTQSRTYMVTPTSVMNQTLIGINDVNLDTRPGNAAFPNTINLTGAPAEFMSMSGRATLNVGSSSAPVDIDEINGRFTTDLEGDKNYYNQDANNSNHPYVFQVITAGDPDIQIQDMHKGTFRISHYENYYDDGTPVNMYVFGGSTVDQFDIAGLVRASNVVLYGAGGDDICRTTNGTWSSQNDDLDDVFTGASFAYFGGTGSDYLDLNDINDETNDGDGVYQLDTWRFLKNAVQMIVFDASTERIQLIGDNSANDIYFTTNPNSQVTIAGAGGNDALYAGNFGNLSTHAARATISGGDGTDTLIVTTASDNAITQYDFDNGNEFSWNVGATKRSMIYDGSLEQLRLTGNANDTPYNLRRIAPTLGLTVDANAGDDTFTVGGGDLDNNGFRFVTVSGSSGNDAITFDDSLDAPTPGETEEYTWTSVGLSKGPGVSIVAGGFEAQTLKTGGVNASPSVPNTVNLNSNSVLTNISGSGNRPTTVNVTQGNLNTIQGHINIAMPTNVANDILNINDQANVNSGVEYQLTRNDFARSVGAFITQTIHFTGVNRVNLNANATSSALAAFTSEADFVTSLNGGSGNNTFYIGQGDLDAQLLGAVEINGGGGIDTIRFNNSSDLSGETQTLNGNTFTDGATHSWSGVEIVRILTGAGGGTVNVTSATTETFIDGNAGADVVNVGNNRSLDAALFAPITFNGGAGNDLLFLDDRNDTGNDSYELLGGLFRKFSTAQSPPVNWNGVETQTLQANDGNNFIFVGSGVTSRLNIFANGGNDRIDTNGSHDVTVDTGPEAPAGGVLGDELNVNFDGVAATVQVRASDRIADVLVRFGGKLQLLGGTLDVTNSLAFDNAGTIDVSGGAMVVRNAASQTAQYRNWVRNGYANGAWNGTNANGAINSSLAASSPGVDGVGFAPASGIFSNFPAVWSGVSIDASSMLLRHTLAGDANLDRVVNLDDFNRLASNFGQSGKAWHQGDVNYDGAVNLNDFNLLAGNFGQTASSAAAAAPDGNPVRSGVGELSRLLDELTEVGQEG